MDIYEFIWLSQIRDKLLFKHHVSQDETEEVFLNRPMYRFVERGHRRGEDMYSARGQTDTGRYLIVYFIRKQGNIALILSGRDMTVSERRLYERRR